MNMDMIKCDHSFASPWIEFDCQSIWDDVLSLGRKIRWKKNSTVIQPADDPVEGIYLIKSGTVKVVATSEMGHQRTLWLQSSGSVIGEAALFAEKPFMHFFVSIEETNVYMFPKSVLLKEIMPKRPDISLFLMRIWLPKVI